MGGFPDRAPAPRAEAWLCSCNDTLPVPRASHLPGGVRLRTFRLLCRQDPAPPEVPVFLGCARRTGGLLAGWEAGGLAPERVVAWEIGPALVGRPGAEARRLVAAIAAAGAGLAAAGLPPEERELPPLPRVAVLGPDGRDAARALAGAAEVVWIDPTAEPGPGWGALPAEPAGVEGRAGAFRIRLAAPHPVDPWACVGCGACGRACPVGALGEDLAFVPDRCDRCAACESACGAAGAVDLGRPAAVEADQVVWPGGRAPIRPGLFLPEGPGGVGEAVVQARALAQGTAAWDPLASPPPACAHSAAGLAGCSRCLEACPTRALSSASGRIERDPLACSGCGACVAACPTGQLDTRPWPRDALAAALEALGRAGAPLRLACVHAGPEGAAGAVGIPLDHLAGVDSWGLAGALLAGSPWIRLAPCPACEPVARAVRRECDRALGRVGLDGRVLLGGAPPPAEPPRPPLPPAPPDEDTLDRRARVLRALWRAAPHAPDLQGPFGSLGIRGRCTGCGACAGVCPTGALEADPDAPILRVTEVGCVGCGLCRSACPEAVLGLDHGLRWAGEVFAPRVLWRGEAHACPGCGRVFATRGAVEAVAERLRARGVGDPALVELCPDCRAVRALGEGLGEAGG